MNLFARITSGRSGMIFHAAAAVLVFVVWRIAGMPSPGLLGRLVPLSWIITAIVFGRGGIPKYSIYLLAVFIFLSVFWSVSPVLGIVVSASAFAGVFPGLLKVSSRKYGILLAMLPIVPLILILVPFTGDEPHYASITERLISPETAVFGSFASQTGDPVGNFTHHQSFYPALMIPGYPLSVPGMRSMNLLFALIALMLLSLILAESGEKNAKKLAVLGFILVPGCSILGLLYPGWFAMAVFLSAVYAAFRSRSSLWVIACAAVLVMIKFRFIGISVGLFIALIIESEGRKKFILPLTIACFVAAGLLIDLTILNGRIFWVRYGNMEFINTILLGSLNRAPEMLTAAGSTLVDIESGLLWKAPWVLAGLAGLPVLMRKNRRLFLWLGLPALSYFLILIFWAAGDWSGMPTPAGRMLLPLVPVLLASLGYIIERKDVRMLVWASLGISAVYFTYPVFRFNYADGTDALLSWLSGPFSSVTDWVPSAVRMNIPIFAGWLVLSVAIIWLIARKSRYTGYIAVSSILLLCLLGGLEKRNWEAEDIPPEYRNYCSIYPDETDILSRKYWFFSRETMLLMSNKEDAVTLPVPSSAGDSLEVTVFHRSFRDGPETGIEVSCGEWCDSLYASSETLNAPGWMLSIKDVQIPDRPENLREIRSEFTVPVTEGAESVRIAPLGMDGDIGRYHGIYLDRILIR